MARDSCEGKLARERAEAAERRRPLPGAAFWGCSERTLQKEASALSGSSVLGSFWERGKKEKKKTKKQGQSPRRAPAPR